MSQSIKDARVVIDMRNDAKGWFANVCGLTNVVRILCALQHAGVASADIIGQDSNKAKAEFSKHPLYKRAKEKALVIHCKTDCSPTEHAVDLLFDKPVVLSTATIKALLDAGTSRVPTSLPNDMPGFLCAASTKEQRQEATKMVLASVGKPMLHSGLASVLLLQPIAKVINRPLCHTPFTPNQITILGFLFGLASLPLLWDGSRAKVILAVSLLMVGNILDQIDGQLARIKFLFSSYGEKLDHHLDGVMKALLFVPMGTGIAHLTGQQIWIALGWLGAVSHVIFAGTMIYYVRRFGGKNGVSSNFRFWYKVKEKGSEPEKPKAPSNPNAIKGRYFLRKDFTHTMFFVFGLLGFIEAPFLLTVFGSALYAGICLVQLIFFHSKVQLYSDYHGV